MINEEKPRLVSDISTREECEEMKTIMEIFFIGYRMKVIAPHNSMNNL